MGTAGLSLTADVGVVSSLHTYNARCEHPSGFPWKTHLQLETLHGRFPAKKNLVEPHSQRKREGGQPGGEDSVETGIGLPGSWKGLKHDISMEDGGDGRR